MMTAPDRLKRMMPTIREIESILEFYGYIMAKSKANSWAILPAAKELFGKNKVTLKEVAAQMKSGTVVVCRKPNNQIHYIAGAAGSYAELNTKHAVHHDQNPKMTFGGEFEVIDEVTYETKEDGQVAFMWKKGETLGKVANEEFKACLAVFK